MNNFLDLINKISNYDYTVNNVLSKKEQDGLDFVLESFFKIYSKNSCPLDNFLLKKSNIIPKKERKGLIFKETQIVILNLDDYEKLIKSNPILKEEETNYVFFDEFEKSKSKIPSQIEYYKNIMKNTFEKYNKIEIIIFNERWVTI